MHERVGARVRRHREQGKVSVEELAERTGIAPEHIRRIEERDDYASLGPLLRISRGLGVRLGDFIDGERISDPLVTRLADRHQDILAHTEADAPAAMRYYSLGRGKAGRHMEPFYIELLPDGGGERPRSSHEGEEFIVVISGHVTVYYRDEAIVLNPGDSIYYDSVVPHYVGAAGSRKAEIYAVLYLPH